MRPAWPSAASLVVVHLIGIPLTGTSVNPARSLGPALIVGGTALSQVWLFIVAPLVGGVAAAAVHLLIAGRADVVTPEALADRSPLASRRWNSKKVSTSSGPVRTAC